MVLVTKMTKHTYYNTKQLKGALYGKERAKAYLHILCGG